MRQRAMSATAARPRAQPTRHGDARIAARRSCVRTPRPADGRSRTRAAAAEQPARAPCCGPLLAVCGLCGGAGASTLAYLIALAAARAGAGPVLVADTGGPSGGLACYAGVEAPRSLAEVAEHLAAGLPTGQLVATHRRRAARARDRPALHARVPARRARAAARPRARAHALTVIDCGTLAREADQVALAAPRTSPGCCPRPQRRAPRPARARGGQPLPAGPRADRRPPRRARGPRRRCASSGGSPSSASARWSWCPTSPPRDRQARSGARAGAGAAAGDPRSARAMSAAGSASPGPAAPAAIHARVAPRARPASRAPVAAGVATVALAALIAAALTVACCWSRCRDPRGARGPGARLACVSRSPASRRPDGGVDLRPQRQRAAGRARAAADRPARRHAGRAARRAPSGCCDRGGEVLLAGVSRPTCSSSAPPSAPTATRMVRAVLPHGPVELAAYALALALYLQGRRRPLPAAPPGRDDRGQRRAARARRAARDLRERMRPGADAPASCCSSPAASARACCCSPTTLRSLHSHAPANKFGLAVRRGDHAPPARRPDRGRGTRRAPQASRRPSPSARPRTPAQTAGITTPAAC